MDVTYEYNSANDINTLDADRAISRDKRMSYVAPASVSTADGVGRCNNQHTP